MDFETLLHKLRRFPPLSKSLTIIALDPGETTGWCEVQVNDPSYPQQSVRFLEVGQKDTPTVAKFVDAFDILIMGADIVICEDYKVYGWLSKQHSWASLHTPKCVGVAEALCHIHQNPFVLQMAVQAKPFCTDEKLEEWGFYKKGQRHARDSIRHACHYLLFDPDMLKRFS